MPHKALLAVRIICTVEGGAGLLLNLYLIVALSKKRIGCSTEKIYMIPLIVATIQGLLFNSIVVALNYAPTFQNGSFIIALVGPIPRYLPLPVMNVLMEIGLVLATMSWTLIPATGMLQLSALSRTRYSTWKRLLICFSFSIACVIETAISATTLVPEPEFRAIMERTMRELYHMNSDDFVLPYGATWNHVRANGGRGFVIPAVFFIILPYVMSYAAFLTLVLMIRKRLHYFGHAISMRTMRMQHAFYSMHMLQGLLPLAILFVPFCLFLFGALSGVDMDYRVSLTLAAFLWMCPVVQATVQIRFVRKNTEKQCDPPSRSVSNISKGINLF